MGMGVVCGAMLQCPFGAAPTPLMVLPEKHILESSMPVATIKDNKPLINILPFGMCNNMANPTVAAATAAAMGVLTQMPCVPATTAPWSPGNPTVQFGGTPALTQDSKLMCMWGGAISINMPGQFTVQY